MQIGRMGRVVQIPQSKITPNPAQPRKSFSEADLLPLAQSIRENGVLQPILVRKIKDGFELIAGERRLRASILAGQTTIPSIILRVGEEASALIALLENLQRRDLDLFEEADGIARLIAEYGLTQEEAAERLGKTQSTIANKLRLRRFTPPEREAIRAFGLTERHARALLRVPDAAARRLLLEEAAHRGLNVAQTERLVEGYLQTVPRQKPQRPKTGVVKDVRIFFNTVSRALDLMRQSGIAAQEEQVESDDFIEYIIRIPKTNARQKTA